ncbi:MAG: hydroxymethylpyrimidine/phosphomethylpyrimidine kinase [Crocinitomicaceae bacterium]
MEEVYNTNTKYLSSIKKRPNILTIAGFDPSGGAGILADIKTFEQNSCIGMAVQTANTIQSGSVFLDSNWIGEDVILKQLNILLSSYTFKYVKIGLVPNLILLNTLIKSCIKHNRNVKIIWDPVLSTTSGHNFDQDLSSIAPILKQIHLITPNHDEALKLSRSENPKDGAYKLSKHCMVLLKGGHCKDNLGYDILFFNDQQIVFKPKSIRYFPKHGTGCILASAITSNLAKGYTLQKSVLRSKRYIEHFIESNSTLIGSHKP